MILPDVNVLVTRFVMKYRNTRWRVGGSRRSYRATRGLAYHR